MGAGNISDGIRMAWRMSLGLEVWVEEECAPRTSLLWQLFVMLRLPWAELACCYLDSLFPFFSSPAPSETLAHPVF